MAEFFWSEQDTSPGRIEAALRDLLQQTYAEDAFVPARVLNLIAVVDREWRGEIENRLERVGRYHPSRTIICSIDPGRTTRSEEHTSELQSQSNLVCRLLLEKKK